MLCVDVEISAGSLDISVAYHGFPIYSESKDLCEKTDCPVKKGPVKVALEEPFPIITPPVSLILDGSAGNKFKTVLIMTCSSGE